MNLLEQLRQCPFVLAPMAAITDCSFRSFMREMGSPIVVSELVSAKGLEHQSPKTIRLMSFDKVQHPVGIQLFGEDPQTLADACRFVQDTGADFIDLNLGCPVPKVVKKGAGSAMLKDLPLLGRVLKAMVDSVEIPVTIKIRSGWDKNTRNAEEVCNLAYNEGVTWVAIHGRTRSEGYSGLADWDYIGWVKQQTKIAIIGNGDIMSADQAVERLDRYGLDGVMIGRGALKNPWIFQESQMLWQGHKNFEAQRDFIQVFSRLRDHYVQHCDERITNIQLRKFAAWFSSGYPGSAGFRKNLFQTQSVEETFERVLEYFTPLSQVIQEDTSSEPFLMGGHG